MANWLSISSDLLAPIKARLTGSHAAAPSNRAISDPEHSEKAEQKPSSVGKQLRPEVRTVDDSTEQLDAPTFLNTSFLKIDRPTTVRAATRNSAQINLWVADAAAMKWLITCVDEDRAEFAKIKQPAVRWRAMSARILLRVALSDAVADTIAPTEWTFDKAANGKKSVAPGLPMVRFSVSHNDEMAVVAVSRVHNLGVDVEANTTKADEDTIANFFSSNEIGALSKDTAERDSQFIRYWTLKEAYTKMTGEGLSADFTKVEFAVEEDKMLGNDTTRFERFDIEGCQISLAIGADIAGLAGEVKIRELV